MISSLSHRGPDDSGVFEDDGAGLANARLSIIDLEGGHQPMSDETGQIWTTFNGEIFNFQEQRDWLERKGHEFATKSDTEVLVHLYEDLGLDFVTRLNGMFAFALWDSRKRELILARDYAGMKPLYYSLPTEGSLHFASEIKALFLEKVAPPIDPASLEDFLTLGYVPSRRTMFEGIYKLRPGQILRQSSRGLTVSSFHQFLPESAASTDNRTYELRLNHELHRASDAWLLSDVPIGAYISGGLDSSLIAALALEKMEQDLKTYTAWFGSDYSNELDEAQLVAEHLAVENCHVLVDEQEVLRKLPRIAWFYDEPIADAAIIPTFFVSRRASRNVKVVLAGEGGDELFGGYPQHKLFHFLEFLQSDNFHLSNVNQPRFRHHLLPKLSSLVWPDYSLAQRYILFHSILQPALVQRLLPKARMGSSLGAFGQYLEAQNGSRLARVLLCEVMTRLAESFLMKADKGSMANSVEERTPYLDKNLMEFAFRIPDHMKVTLGRGKVILRRAARGILPKATLRRRKRGYGTPVRGWVRGEIGDYFADLIESSEILTRMRDYNGISRIVKARSRRPKQFWLLGSLALWEHVFYNDTSSALIS